MANKTKCTCKHRLAVNARNWLYPHEPDCYYERLRQEQAKNSKQRETAETLYNYYRRQAKNKEV